MKYRIKFYKGEWKLYSYGSERFYDVPIKTSKSPVPLLDYIRIGS